MNFLLPAAFAAFAALLLPILIHLSRRSQTQRTEFAALRWIGAKLRPRRRPVVQEWLLLLLRLLLIAVVVLWLAAPVWQRSAPPRDWLLVTPGVDWRGVSDLPAGETVQRRWLAPGFLPLSAPSPSAQAVPTASLLREWDAVAPAGDRLTVLVPKTLGGLDGERLRLSRAVVWRVLPGSSAPRRTPDTPLPALTLFGRTYAIGYETALADTLVGRPVRTMTNPAWPWAVWYPLRRAGAFEHLSADEQRTILMEHGGIGRSYGRGDHAHDVRLACHGLDTFDNDFIAGLLGRELYPLSHVVQRMRKTQQTSRYLTALGPFFVGHALWQSPLAG